MKRVVIIVLILNPSLILAMQQQYDANPIVRVLQEMAEKKYPQSEEERKVFIADGLQSWEKIKVEAMTKILSAPNQATDLNNQQLATQNEAP